VDIELMIEKNRAFQYTIEIDPTISNNPLIRRRKI